MPGPLDIMVPEVNPSGAPDDYQRISSSPAMFGGLRGEAEKEFGHGLTSAGDAALSYLTEQNSLNNQIHASELHSWYSDQAGDLISAHSELQGRAAVDQLPDLKAKLQDLQKQVEAQAGNLPTKAMVAANTRRTQDWFIGTATRHADSQRTEWAKKTAADNITSATNVGGIAVENSDFTKLDEQMDVISREAHNHLDPLGYDPQTLDVEVSKFKGNALKNWVGTAMTNTADPDALTHAKNIYDRYSNDADPASRLAISKELNTRLQARAVDNLSNYFVNGTVAGIPGRFIAGIKQSEGFKDKPYWDVNHWSVGYGTRASGPDEKSDRFTLETRFEDELTKSADFVDSVAPHLDPGTRAALVSLTYNTGQKWATQGLGDAIKAGDLMKAQQLFLQYNTVAGQPDPSITQRRLREAQWIGQNQPQNVSPQDAASILDRVRSDPAFQGRPELQIAVQKNILAKAALEQRADTLQQKAQKEASDGEELKFFFAIHGNQPVTLDDINAAPNMTREAKERMSEQLLKLKGTEEREEKSYGSGFYDLYRKIHLPDGNAERITDESQLFSHVGPNGDLSVKGVDKLVAEIQARKSPEGVAESEMKAQFLKNARAQITGSDEGLHIKDPKGDELYLKFLAQVLPQYDAERRAGKNAASLFNPDSNDYLGKAITTFRRKPEDWYADIIADHDQKDKGFDETKIKSLDDLQKAYRDGNVARERAMQIAVDKGWATRKAPEPPMPQVPRSLPEPITNPPTLGIRG
jgi:GH24 family phage-related lysozyme (muramidase)